MAEKTRRGGARPNSGRPKRDDRLWGQITCILKRETIEQLRRGCGGAQKHFGPFLQDHLDRHPLPDRETYEYFKKMKELANNRKGAPLSQWDKEVRALRRAERERRRAERKKEQFDKWAATHPKEAKMVRAIVKGTNKVMKERAREAAKAAKVAA